ncbi:methylenetetrahydrofolate reductase [NAD(P)H] [Henriciella aquimarina]|uniref:methylenetetrahydrofolate reductase [NAD(P)H] n=1 Tax=Henriciella aquimarina TaxID=545261 RepID=UPI000A002612|nr:methylenetetrahydrofolate reductase [NAD(P)H] [Henriciella aquimarina]
MSDLAIATRQTEDTTPQVSFEFFPPKNEKMTEKLWECVKRLEPMSPHFVSVTYGAGGSTRTRTYETVKRIAQETTLTPAAHLTCVGAPREEVLQTADDYYEAGVRHIVALRGDAPQEEDFAQPEGRYTNVVDLVSDLRAHRPDLGKVFEISVACYPEPHPDSRGWEADLAHLKAKQDAGADRAITQFFFEPDVYFDFVDKARAAGITIPLVPGIMLQSNFNGLKNFAKMCGASLPDWLHQLYEGLDDDPATRDLITANVAAELCHKLADGGVNQFHFYTLNKANLALSTCHLLGLKPAQAEAA